MSQASHNRSDKRVRIAAGLLAAVLALLGSQQLPSGRTASAVRLGDIAYRAASFGTLSGEHQQVALGRAR